MPFFLMSVPAAAFIIAVACPQPPPVKVNVRSHVDEIIVGTQFDLAQIRELSDRSGRRPKHTPFGFYASKISGVTSVNIGNDQQDLCAGPIEVEVTIELTSRQIEIGRDLRNNACQFNVAVAHYRQHAEADVAVFRRYVLVVMQTLTRTPLPDLFSAAGNDGVLNNNFAPVIQFIIEPMLIEMHAEQALAIAAVDSPAEIWRLGQTCNGQL